MRIFDRNNADYDTLVFESYDAVYLVANGEPGLLRWLVEKFTIKMPDWKFTPAARFGDWKGDVHFVGLDGKIPISFLPHVVRAIDDAGYKWYADIPADQIIDQNVTMESVKAFSDMLLEGTKFKLRDYQLYCVWKMLQRKRGVIEVSVGGGKSIISYVFARVMLRMGHRVLLIVPTVTLVSQLRADFQDYGWTDLDAYSVFIGGSKLLKVGPMEQLLVVSTWQSCVKYGREWFASFGALLIDEAHGAKADSMRIIGENTVNAWYRIGMTGTMPESEFDCLRVESILGDVIAEVTSSELIAMGVLTPVQVVTVFASHPFTTRPFQVRDYHVESSFIEECDYRRAFICKIINVKIPADDNVLILVKSISQLEQLSADIEKKCSGRQVFKFYGGVGDREREEIRTSIENLSGVIVIATFKTFSTGVNVPRLHHLMLASTSRAKVSVIQSAGRVLRRHSTKDLAMVWDIVDVFPWDLWALHAPISDQNKEKNHSFSVLHQRKRKRYFIHAGFPITEFDVQMVDGK